jgi:hypothetical protein
MKSKPLFGNYLANPSVNLACLRQASYIQRYAS